MSICFGLILLKVLSLIKGYRLNGFLEGKRPLVSLVYQMVSGRDVVVTIRLKALYRVIGFEIVLIDNLSQQIVVIRHLLESRVEAGFPIRWWCNLLEPRMLANSCNGCSLFWVCVQNFREEISTLIRYKFWYLVVGTQNFLV